MEMQKEVTEFCQSFRNNSLKQNLIFYGNDTFYTYIVPGNSTIFSAKNVAEIGIYVLP